MLGLAALSRRKRHLQRDRSPDWSGPDRRCACVQLAIHATAEQEHRENGARCKGDPLSPVREGWCQSSNDTHHYRRTADEDQVELRVDEDELRTQEYRAGDRPPPPVHVD